MPDAPHSAPAQHVILFDGVCNLCNASVRFVLKRDPNSHFQFAALQSSAASKLLKEAGRAPESTDLSTIVLIEDGAVYTRSTAALRIARRLGGLWPMFYAFIVVPRPLRDLGYRLIAHYRYRWFGRQDVCMVPTPEIRSRFLETPGGESTLRR